MGWVESAPNHNKQDGQLTERIQTFAIDRENVGITERYNKNIQF